MNFSYRKMEIGHFVGVAIAVVLLNCCAVLAQEDFSYPPVIDEYSKKASFSSREVKCLGEYLL